MENPGSAYCGIDNLSRLPDDILSRILSLLCTEDVVRTSLLSTRWRYLYTSISNLDLKFNSEVLKITDEQDCMNFVDRFLFNRKKCAIDKFELTWKMSQALDPLRLENWIKSVLGHGIRELDLCIYDFNPKYLMLPSSLFTCKSLEVLKLKIWLKEDLDDGEDFDSEACDYGLELPAEVCLPSLKSIHLRNVSFSEDSWSRLFSSCPILEDFFFHWEWGNCKLNVSNPMLKRLTVEQEYGLFDVFVDAPSLVYLGFSMREAQSLKVVNARSLVEANIHVFRPGYGTLNFISGCNELMTGISNIQTLRMCTDTLEVLERYRDFVPIPVLPNMTHLTIYACDSHYMYDLDSLPYLLEKCESLETLVFEDLFVGFPHIWDITSDTEEARMSCLASAVKTIKVCRFTGNIDEFEMVKYFLKTARALELIEIHLYSKCKNPSNIASELQKLPKNSEAFMDVIF